MAYQDTHSSRDVLSVGVSKFGRVMRSVASFFEGFGESVSKAAIARARYNTLMDLHAKSDAELSALNLTRDSIVHHVYRDLYYS